MNPNATSGERTRARRKTWGVSALLLLPVLILIGLAATAAGSIGAQEPLAAPATMP